MDNRKPDKDLNKVGGHIFEELFFEFIEKKYSISKEDLLLQLEKSKHNSKKIISNSSSSSSDLSILSQNFPVCILKNDKLSSLEAIVKFLRENKKLSYNIIGKLLSRNPGSLAVTYNVASKKMQIKFNDSVDNDANTIPFTAFNNKLSVLESICIHLKLAGHSYSDIAKLLGKDQRTVWTVCKRAENKSKTSSRNNVRTSSENHKNNTKSNDRPR